MKPSAILILWLLIAGMVLHAQPNDDRPVDIQANSLTDGVADGFKINILKGDVRIKYEDIVLTCDSAYDFRGKKQVKAFSNVVINQGDSLRITGDSLLYNSKNDIAKMYGNVFLDKPGMSLQTDFLTYYTEQKDAIYRSGGRLVKDSTILESRVGFYNDETEVARFSREVTIANPNFDLWADTLHYEMKTDRAIFFGPTVIISKGNRIYCERGFYDTRARNGTFRQNARMQEGVNEIMADTLHYDQASGNGKGLGNVFFRDTSEDVTLFSGATIYDMETGDVEATDSPTILLNFDGDTLQIAADTLESVGDSNRTLKAYRNAKFYKSSLQGHCDSLAYSEADSMIYMFHDPVMWVDSFQFTGDTIKLQLENQKLDALLIRKNAFLAGNEGQGIFNQIKGKTLTGKFEKDTLRSMIFDGNAETIYFAKDDSGRVIGPNSLTCGSIYLLFKDSDLETIKFYSNPDGQTDPIQNVNMDNQKLEGFKWRGSDKPHPQRDFTIREVQFLPIQIPAWAVEQKVLPQESIKD